MNVKKSLENRLRGWLPKEPTVSKTPAKIGFQKRTETDNQKQNSPSFKIRRWLHGVSAVGRSLMRQMSLRTKITAVAFGVYFFTLLSLLFLVERNLISVFADFLVGYIAYGGFLLVIGVGSLYDYFKKKAFSTGNLPQNKVGESVKLNLKLWSTIIIVIGAAMMISTFILGFYNYYLIYNSPFIVLPFYLGVFPYYLGLFGLSMVLLGWLLSMERRKRNKLNLFRPTYRP
jgi:hypothetical protein